MLQTIYTIGHNQLSFMQFINLLQKNNINHLIDIRSIPYSRHAPWSNKSRLPEMLKAFNIRYSYLGHKLGGKKQSNIQEARLKSNATEAVYNEGIQILLNLSIRENISLMCAESDPTNCHRQHVIAQTLLNSDVKVFHIMQDGSLKEAWQETSPPEQAKLFN
jgi:uncharacterized protein (DUF488 family)